GELKRTATVRVHIDENERLGRVRQAYRNSVSADGPKFSMRLGHRNECRIAIIDRERKVLEKIVAEIAINLCTDCFANVAKIDNANIDIIKLSFAHGEGINFRQRDRNFSACAKTLLCSDNFHVELFREFRRKQRSARTCIQNKLERSMIVYADGQQNERLRTAGETELSFCPAW